MRTFAEQIRYERRDMTYAAFSDIIEVEISNISKWEKGHTKPMDITINRLAKILGWSDELRMSFMPEPVGEELVKQMTNKRRLLFMTQVELAEVLGVSTSSIKYWTYNRVTKANRKRVEEFINAEPEEIQALLNKIRPKPKRKKKSTGRRHRFDIKLLQRIEHENNGSVLNAKSDDPLLIKLRKQVGAL